MTKTIAVFGVLCMCLTSINAKAGDIEMPELDHPWTDGLYSTITEHTCTGGIKPKNAQKVKLNISGFKSELVVRAVIQNHSAPLVVILNGTYGRPNEPSNNLWMAWLEERGFHVLNFDSTFHPAMTELTRLGVAGNLEAEAELSSRIIQAFITQEMPGKMSKLGVVGMSYGGTQALLLSKMEREGRLPFKIDAVQAYSPPISMSTSMRILDENFTYEWKLSDHFWEFGKMKREFPVTKGYDPQMARAALSRVFRLELKDVIEKNDTLFGAELERAGVSRLLPRGDKTERLSYAEVTTFERYFEDMVVPYWQTHGRQASRAELLEAGELSELMRHAGSSVQAILATNDPLNEPGSAERLKHESLTGRLIVLPRGGHMGYLNANWTRSKLCGIFNVAPVIEVAFVGNSRN